MVIRKLFRAALSLGIASSAMVGFATAAHAQEAAPADDAASDSDAIVVTAKATRSATAIAGPEIQKILPGISPLKAIQTLPGVLYITADPWGNNEQNAQLFIHGFSAGQLGYTMDGVPLGDQNYGNYNGLSPQRAVMSENVARVVVATGAADLGTASTSNLGGAIETFSSDPRDSFGIDASQTFGSYGTSRTYVRLDTGKLGGAWSAYLSGDRQRARAWDFNGRQGGWQANGKLVREDETGKLSLWFAYSDKIEPNEDATTIYRDPTVSSITSPASASASAATIAARSFQPYTRPFTYPDFAAAVAYLDASGNVPATSSINYRNYYSDAQRTDYLSYLRYQWHVARNIDWTNQIYYHHNDGVGVVAGPITVASLPTLFALYFPGQNLKLATGNSGYAIRTTEYAIERKGAISTLNLELGAHRIELGAWYEHNASSAYRRWYALDVNHPELYSPYIRPSNPLFTQYGSEIRNDVVQLHVQDAWTPLKNLTVEAGFKSSLQHARGFFTVQPIVGSLAGSASALPNGRIDTDRWFLPAIGAKWGITSGEEAYFNIQKNLRQYQTYGAGGSAAPWSVGSQAAFDLIAAKGQPETSWTYEAGLRTKHALDFAGLTSIEAQINYFHVDFSNRLLAITPSVGGIAGSSISGGTPALFNVGAVKTDGVDAAFTLRFGPRFSLYNAVSYNSSVYQSDYSSTSGNGASAATGTCIGGIAVVNGVVPTCGKQVPGSPRWMNKTVATLNYGMFEAQLVGDYVGRRFATYANDTSVPSYFLASLRLGVELPAPLIHVRKAELSLNVTNLFDTQGWSTVSVGSANNTYSVYPIAPRQVFGTLAVGF